MASNEGAKRSNNVLAALPDDWNKHGRVLLHYNRDDATQIGYVLSAIVKSEYMILNFSVRLKPKLNRTEFCGNKLLILFRRMNSVNQRKAYGLVRKNMLKVWKAIYMRACRKQKCFSNGSRTN